MFKPICLRSRLWYPAANLRSQKVTHSNRSRLLGQRAFNTSAQRQASPGQYLVDGAQRLATSVGEVLRRALIAVELGNEVALGYTEFLHTIGERVTALLNNLRIMRI